MKPSEGGAVPKRLMAIQLAVLASLAAFYFLYLPHRAKRQAAAGAQEREQKIEAILQSLVVEAGPSAAESPGADAQARLHAQRLIRLPEVEEVVDELGLPDRRTTDFRGGLHLTWTGTAHSLEASFDRGRLYCLSHKDLRTGHGALVFESSARWNSF
jgi:hypothetical protein